MYNRELYRALLLYVQNNNFKILLKTSKQFTESVIFNYLTHKCENQKSYIRFYNVTKMSSEWSIDKVNQSQQSAGDLYFLLAIRSQNNK